GASPVFTITGAELGSTAGYGQVYDFTTSPQGGQQQHLRLVVEAAIRDGVAVEMMAASLFIPDQNEHPSPAQMEPRVESLADQVGNTVVWRGEPSYEDESSRPRGVSGSRLSAVNTVIP